MPTCCTTRRKSERKAGSCVRWNTAIDHSMLHSSCGSRSFACVAPTPYIYFKVYSVVFFFNIFFNIFFKGVNGSKFEVIDQGMLIDHSSWQG